MADVFGPELVWAFTFRFGGERIYVPITPTPSSRLLEVVPEEQRERFCKDYGGTYLDIPIASSDMRKLLVERLLKEGRSTQAIIRMAKISRRSVYRIKAELLAEGGWHAAS